MPEEIKFARESWGKWHRVTEVSPGRFYPIGKTACGRCGGRFWRDSQGRLLPHLRKRRDDG